LSGDRTKKDAQVSVGNEKYQEDNPQTEQQGDRRRGPLVEAVEHADSEDHENGDV